MHISRRIKSIPGIDGALAYSIKPGNIITDPNKMTATVTITTEVVDRSRDVVVTKGLDLSDHAKNPVALLDHKQTMPVGVAKNASGEYTVRRVSDTRIDATTHFHQHTKLGEEAFRLVESGVLRGASIGFIPLPNTIQKGHDPYGDVTIYGGGRLIEYSHLVLPDNPDCLVVAVQKGFGGKKLSPELLNYLSARIPPRSATVVSGFANTKGKVTKMFDEDDDDTLAGGMADDTPMGDPVDDSALPDDGDMLDLPAADEIDDEFTMNAGAQFAHGINDKLTDVIGFITEALNSQEHDGMAKVGNKILASLGKALEQLQSAYSEYKAKFPDQPDLPMADVDADGIDDEVDEEIEVDEEPDADNVGGDPDGDADDVVEKEGDDMDTFDDEGDEDDYTEKNVRRWIRKCRAAWDWWKEAHTNRISDAQMKEIDAVKKSLASMQVKLAGGVDKPTQRKMARVCKGMFNALNAVEPTKANPVVVTKSVKQRDDEQQLLSVLMELDKRVADIESDRLSYFV